MATAWPSSARTLRMGAETTGATRAWRTYSTTPEA